ncbi:hypothetical protein JCM13210_18510 [Thermaerobacter litoralis]
MRGTAEGRRSPGTAEGRLPRARRAAPRGGCGAAGRRWGAAFGTAGLVAVFLGLALAGAGPGAGRTGGVPTGGVPGAARWPGPGLAVWGPGGPSQPGPETLALVVRTASGRPVAAWAVEPGREVQLEYLHSLFHVPVRERLRVTPAGFVPMAVEAPSPDIAWYYGGGPEGRWQLERLAAPPRLACGGFGWSGGPDGAWYRLAALGLQPAGVPVSSLRIRATPTGKRSLVVAGRCWPLLELVGVNGEAVLTVSPGAGDEEGRRSRFPERP